MKDFSGGDTENSTMKAGKTNMGRLSKVEISGVNTSKLPVLSREEAKVLFQQARAGSEEARQTLIQGNLRLVLSVIKKFDGRNENPDDLFQVGCVGLIKGIDNFNVDLDVFPSTYLVPMIVGEIRRYLRDNSSVRVSRSMRDTAYKVLQAKEKYVAVIPYTKEELEGDMTLEDVTDILVQEIAGGVTGGTVSEESTVQIAGRSASIARVDGTVDNLKVTYWISCLETDDSFVEILGWTLANRANANKKDIQSVMCSLQVN